MVSILLLASLIWLAWISSSRTSIKREKQKCCGDARAWNHLVVTNAQKLSRLQPTPSDHYGWSCGMLAVFLITLRTF
jgi:hypothetical protein